MGIEVGYVIEAEGMEWVVIAITPFEIVARSVCGRLLRVHQLRDEAHEKGLDTCLPHELPLAA